MSKQGAEALTSSAPAGTVGTSRRHGRVQRWSGMPLEARCCGEVEASRADRSCQTEDLVGNDIDRLLREWEFNPASNVRKVVGEGGVQMVQVRVDQGAFQGILQLYLDGRPDGKRPHGEDFALDYYRHSLEAHRRQAGGPDEGFTLNSASCKELFDESSRVYGRYVFLLQIKEYGRVVRDTERNMDLFRFVNEYAAQEDDRMNLEKWWPYVLRIHATARALLSFQGKDYDGALGTLEQAKEEIAQLPQVDAEEFAVERERSAQALDELIAELTEKRPPTETERLQNELEEAVEREDFERAAVLRDQMGLPGESHD